MNASCGISTFPNWRILFLPAFCLSSSLRLRGGVAAVAFGGYVFAQGRDGFAGDDPATDGGLNGDFEQVIGDQLF